MTPVSTSATGTTSPPPATVYEVALRAGTLRTAGSGGPGWNAAGTAAGIANGC
jgi:hypothetical protein